jgi:hypothetical protein
LGNLDDPFERYRDRLAQATVLELPDQIVVQSTSTSLEEEAMRPLNIEVPPAAAAAAGRPPT